MAEWNKNKVLPSAINGGKEFTEGDNLAVDELNAIVNNSFYASNISETSIAKADSAVSISKLAEEKIDAFIKTEGNSVVTIGGVPQTAWSADFAESERQKSKNLFNFSKIPYHSGTTTIDYVNETITTSIYAVNLGEALPVLADLKAGVTYTLSLESTSDNKFIVLLDSSDNAIKQWYNNASWTPTQSELDSIAWTYVYGANDGSTQTISKIQIEEGTIATDYQSYNGAIVHEKDIVDVEHVETIYNIKTKNVLNDVAYTNGILVGSIVSSDEFAGYKALIVKSYRNQTRLTTEINLSGDTGNASGTPAIDASGDYFVIHSFRFYKNNNTFTFEHGGYMYVNSGDATFVKETSDSDNRIVEILGVK